MSQQHVIFSENEMNQAREENLNQKLPKKVRFKPYDIGNNYIFPPTTDEYLPKTHLARLISVIIDKIDITDILEKYKGGGTSAYHPRMMLKVWLLGFVYKIYTSRQLELALQEHLAFIWISGDQKPDFRTLNNFRLLLKNKIKKIFKKVVQLGLSLGLIEGKDVFVDHTKIEANANKHKIVWKKAVEKQIEKIDKEIEELFEHIEKLNDEEDEKYGESGKEIKIKSFDIKKIDQMIDVINEDIKKKRKKDLKVEELKESRNKLKRTKELLERKKVYDSKQKILRDRNSYSSTDFDATAMMQKDKLNIKPSYNEGIAVENGFIINYEQSDKSADNVSFKEVMDGALNNLAKPIENVHADGAYGTEENSEYLEEKGINNFLKFNTYRQEHSKKWHREKVRKEDFKYLPENDCYVCPNGCKLNFIGYADDITTTGYKIKYKKYLAEEGQCTSCPYKEFCTTSESRSIQINENYEKHKEAMRENLDSEKGKELRKRRGFEVESVFGDRKYNKKYGRFVLKGKKKVEVESGLYYTVHNIRKIYNFIFANLHIPLNEIKLIQFSNC